MNVDLLQRLAKLGFALGSDLFGAVKAYQEFHGLTVNGTADSSTLRHLLSSHRFCNHPDVMADTQVCAWPKKDVTWTIVTPLPGIPAQALKAAYALAFSYWQEVCGLNPLWVDDAAQAMIQIGTRAIDSAGGVLAESELPCGQVSVCHQWYDSGERWVIAESPAQGQIDLVRVACHELGHALGLSHGPAGNLMAPVYSAQIRKPQGWDVQQMTLRYGLPVPVFKPPDGPSPDQSITIKITGSVIEIPGYRVTKLMT